MTMPHLENCPHSCDSWCLDCVKEQWEQLAAVTKELDGLREAYAALRAYFPKEYTIDQWCDARPMTGVSLDVIDRKYRAALQPGDDV